MAVNCWVCDWLIEGLAGDTVMDCREIDLMTVRVSAVLTTLPSAAVICEVPPVMPVASPVFRPMATTAVLEEDQVTLLVMSRELPSL